MSREIKFRGMGIKGNWHYGNLSVLTQKVNHVEAGTYISNSVGLPFAYQVRPETVGQFTGLKDKTGKEIYEGDILSFQNSMISSDDPMPHRRIVKWDDEYGCFSHAYIDGNCRVSGYSWCKENAQEIFEVIGDIYSNPELLKEQTP